MNWFYLNVVLRTAHPLLLMLDANLEQWAARVENASPF